MAMFDPNFLRSIGIEPTSRPVPIPIYTRRRMVDVPSLSTPHLRVSRVEPVPDDRQELVRLVLQVVDGSKLKRYSNCQSQRERDN